MANEDRIRQVVAAIEASPQQFDMRLFINECGTTFCFAGWALKLAGEDMDYWRKAYWPDRHEVDDRADCIQDKAAEWLEIDDYMAYRLFYYVRAGSDINQMKVYITELLGISFDDAVAS